MKSVIKDIYYNKRGDSELIQNSDEYKKIDDELCGLLQQFEKLLTTEQKELFDKIYLLQMGLEAETGAINYVEGFKLGLSVGMETAEDI